jgi:hypothetical protein
MKSKRILYNNDMSLLDDLDKVKNTKTYRNKICAVERLLGKLEPSEATRVAKAIDDPEYQISLLFKVFKDHGYEITASSLYRHRRRLTHGGCICP